jgi:sialidase-1
LETTNSGDLFCQFLYDEFVIPTSARNIFIFIAGTKVLLFSNPTDPSGRDHIGVRQSFDGGKTWTQAYIVDPGPSAYSDIVALPSDHIGIIYEAANNIEFVSFGYNLIPVK